MAFGLRLRGGPVGGEQGSVAGPMVGRDRELAQVAALADEAMAGRGRLVLCTGEAGIGKTRLAEEIAVSAAARGMAVAWACATDRDTSPPYGLWRLALDEPAIRAGGDGASSPDLWAPVPGAAGRPVLADDVDAGSGQRFALFAEGPHAGWRGAADGSAGCCWCLMIFGGRMRPHQRSCSLMSCGSCAGRRS